MGAAMMMSSRGRFSPITVGLGILSLTLGWQVGRGSPHAAMILLGLSISRGVMTFVPGAPEWWTTFPLLTLLELFVFAQAARGAIALAEPDRATAVSASPDGIWARRFFVDCVAVAIIAPLSYIAMNIRIPNGEGLHGVGELFIILVGIFHFIVAIVLLVSGMRARSGKQWAKRVRAVIYWMFLGEVLFFLKLVLTRPTG